MEDILPRRAAVRQEEIDPFATKAAPAQRHGELLSDLEHLAAPVSGGKSARKVACWFGITNSLPVVGWWMSTMAEHRSSR